MQVEQATTVISPESVNLLKEEPFVTRLKKFRVAFERKEIYWQTEKPLIDKNPLAVELALKNRYQATLVALLQKRTGKALNKADFALYKPLAEEIQILADGMGFDSKNPDINIVSFTECCLDKIGILETETPQEKQETQLVKLRQEHLDRLDPDKHPETAGLLKEQFQIKKKGAWSTEVAQIISSDRALRELIVTNKRITPLLIYDLENLLRRPVTPAEMKDVRKMAGALIRLADSCQLYSSVVDLDLLGFLRAARAKAEYTTTEYEETLRAWKARPQLPQDKEVRDTRIPLKLLSIPILIAILDIISQLQALPVFPVQAKPPVEPTPIRAPLPRNYPVIPSPTIPLPQNPDTDTLPVSQTNPPSDSAKLPLPMDDSDTLSHLNVKEKPTPDWIFNPVYSIIKKINEGKEIPLQRQNTLAIALAIRGNENYPSEIVPGRMEWHTDANAFIFVTANPITKKVSLDFVTPFTRDQLSTNTINGGNPKIKLVASLIGKDAYRKEMSAVAGQPTELILLDIKSFSKAIDKLFPNGVEINIPKGFFQVREFKPGKQRLNGEDLYYYLSERMSFTPEKGYPVHGKNIEVTDNVARLEKGLDVIKEIIRNVKEDPPAVLRFKEAIKYLDIDQKLKTTIDDFDFFGNGLGALIGYLTDPNLSDAVTIRFHSTLDLNVPSQYFNYIGTEDQYLDIVSPEPLTAGAQKHFQPITSAIDKIISTK